MAIQGALQAAIAAHRFGLGEPTLDALAGDPSGWLLAQIGPADRARGDALLSTPDAWSHVRAEVEKLRLAKHPPPGMTAAEVLGGHYREVIVADVRSRYVTAAVTARPFAERLQLFWSNHFTVSLTKGSVRGLVGAFERDAIRPHIAGSFEDLLFAAITHPAMLRYLDNTASAGSHSRAVRFAARRAERMQDTPRLTGLNENLAREVLELHTLGAERGRGTETARGGYTQADVTAFAAVLTGWRVGVQDALPAVPFDERWHEPGRKTLLGKTYPEGPDALRMVLHDLARHPGTAQFLATKLARHFVDDDPPPDLVQRLARRYLDTEGRLDEVYRELVRSPQGWHAVPAKLKTPEEFVISSARVTGAGERLFERNGAAGMLALGQRPHAAPSPAGWPDRADDWLGPDAMWKRVEWATRVAQRMGRSLDARALGAASLGPVLSDASRQQIERAADAPQALALLLLCPEFQRR